MATFERSPGLAPGLLLDSQGLLLFGVSTTRSNRATSLMFRNLPLFKHLLLALVPGVVTAVPIAIAYVGDSYTLPYSELTAAVVYCALFGGFVMALFIKPRSRVILRASVLIVMAPVVYYLVSLLVSFTETLTNNWSIGELSIMIVAAAAVFIFNLLIAVLLVIVAPLNTNLKFWGFVGLTGAVTGVLCATLFHYFFCILWCDWTELLMGIPLFVWPLLFCSSIYLWLTQPGGGQNNQLPLSHSHQTASPRYRRRQ